MGAGTLACNPPGLLLLMTAAGATCMGFGACQLQHSLAPCHLFSVCVCCVLNAGRRMCFCWGLLGWLLAVLLGAAFHQPKAGAPEPCCRCIFPAHPTTPAKVPCCSVACSLHATRTHTWSQPHKRDSGRNNTCYSVVYHLSCSCGMARHAC